MLSHELNFHRRGGGGRAITHSDSGALIAPVFLTRRMLTVELPNYKGQMFVSLFYESGVLKLASYSLHVGLLYSGLHGWDQLLEICFTFERLIKASWNISFHLAMVCRSVSNVLHCEFSALSNSLVDGSCKNKNQAKREKRRPPGTVELIVSKPTPA